MLSLLSTFSYLLVFLTLGALAYRDLKEYILPDLLNLTLLVSFISFHQLSGWQNITLLSSLIGGCVAGGSLLLIKTIADRYYNEDSLGLGDVKLIAAAGFGLGFPNIFIALSLGAFIGMFHGLYIAYRAKKETGGKLNLAKANVPAGFGFCIAIGIVFLYF